METQARLIEQEDGVLVPVRRFREEDDEKRHQPLEAFRALIQFNFYPQVILDYGLEVLTIGLNSQAARLGPVRLGIPDFQNLAGQTNARGIELIRAVIELVAITLERVRVGGFGLGCS